jgi:hypothetical protein
LAGHMIATAAALRSQQSERMLAGEVHLPIYGEATP